MYRIVGCILLVAAGTGMGFSGSMKLSERIYTLEMLLRMVNLPERRDPLRKYVSAGCFLQSCRKNGWKIQGISHKCCRQDESLEQEKRSHRYAGNVQKHP